MLSSTETGGVSTWGFVIFFLILFWFFGGNMGFGHNAYDYNRTCHDDLNAMHIQNSHQSERDVLNMGKTVIEQNAATAKTLSDIAYAQEAQTARILEGQKDLYIRDLERAATNMFITSQTNAITNRLDQLEAASALQRQVDKDAISAQIANIQSTMLKTPSFIPCGSMPAVGCCNYGGYNSCGCNA